MNKNRLHPLLPKDVEVSASTGLDTSRCTFCLVHSSTTQQASAASLCTYMDSFAFVIYFSNNNKKIIIINKYKLKKKQQKRRETKENRMHCVARVSVKFKAIFFSFFRAHRSFSKLVIDRRRWTSKRRSDHSLVDSAWWAGPW